LSMNIFARRWQKIEENWTGALSSQWSVSWLAYLRAPRHRSSASASSTMSDAFLLDLRATVP
jgi:hypothetical protein